MAVVRDHIITRLQQDILSMEGFRPANSAWVDTKLGPIKQAFPNATFPLGAVHEFLAAGVESAAATQGFLTALVATLMDNNGIGLWIGTGRMLFPPALVQFGVHPDRIIFVDLKKQREALWVMEEALKCSALSVVVGELQEITFTESRRLQLAVEQSRVTGFLLRNNPRQRNTTTCVSRWRIQSLPSEVPDDLPGIGHPQWRVELLRIRNGRAGTWDIAWRDGKFQPVCQPPQQHEEYHQQTG